MSEPETWSILTGFIMHSLAKRTGETGLTGMKKVNSDQWLQYVDEKMAKNGHGHNELTVGSRGPKAKEPSGGSRSLKVLPFSRETFLRIATKFHIHNSAVKTVSRADIPVFSSANVYMGEREGPRYPAYGTVSPVLTDASSGNAPLKSTRLTLL